MTSLIAGCMLSAVLSAQPVSTSPAPDPVVHNVARSEEVGSQWRQVGPFATDGFGKLSLLAIATKLGGPSEPYMTVMAYAGVAGFYAPLVAPSTSSAGGAWEQVAVVSTSGLLTDIGFSGGYATWDISAPEVIVRYRAENTTCLADIDLYLE